MAMCQGEVRGPEWEKRKGKQERMGRPAERVATAVTE